MRNIGGYSFTFNVRASRRYDFSYLSRLSSRGIRPKVGVRIAACVRFSSEPREHVAAEDIDVQFGGLSSV
jgi:hypothetical protein